MKKRLTSANIAHARLCGHHPYKLHPPLISKTEGIRLAAAILLAYFLSTWIDSWSGT